jgi:hypothetical protein
MRESSQVKEMRESSQVNVMWESSQVNVMWGSSQVKEMRGSSQVKEMNDYSIAILRTGEYPKIYVSDSNIVVEFKNHNNQ